MVTGDEWAKAQGEAHRRIISYLRSLSMRSTSDNGQGHGHRPEGGHGDGRHGLIEINEAFAAGDSMPQEMPFDMDRLNVHGRAIALATDREQAGPRYGDPPLRLRQQGKSIGMASACIGGGRGVLIVKLL